MFYVFRINVDFLFPLWLRRTPLEVAGVLAGKAGLQAANEVDCMSEHRRHHGCDGH